MAKFDLSDEDFLELADIFKLMGSETRLKIVSLISQGELSVGGISDKIKMNTSAVSHQLKEMKLHKIICSRKCGQTVYYKLCDHHVNNILQAAIDHIRGENCEDDCECDVCMCDDCKE